MESYMDFGSQSDTDSDGEGINLKDLSDEEDEKDNARLFKMLMTASTNPVPKKRRDVDDFEAEMEAELDKRANEVETLGGVTHQKKSLSRSSSTSSLNKVSPAPSRSQSPRPGPSTSGKKGAKRVKFASTKDTGDEDMEEKMDVCVKRKASSGILKPEKYDEVYFDSDESDGGDDESKRSKTEKRAFKSDDDLFYDPESDTRDQEWVEARRRKYCSSPSSTGKPNSGPEKPSALPTSDAVLNCPACFTLLCLDCQRHELYKEQYRAMFVMNCNIVRDVTLQVPVKQKKSWKWKKGKRVPEYDSSNPANLPSSDLFNPVKCQVCTTQVAVYDTEEVYHFFNVLASHT